MARNLTLSGALNDLRIEVDPEDFNFRHNCLECSYGQLKMFANKFKIDKFLRFKGPSGPSDEVILYAITSDEHPVKGVLANAYGIYSEPVTDVVLQKLEVR